MPTVALFASDQLPGQTFTVDHLAEKLGVTRGRVFKSARCGCGVRGHVLCRAGERLVVSDQPARRRPLRGSGRPKWIGSLEYRFGSDGTERRLGDLVANPRATKPHVIAASRERVDLLALRLSRSDADDLAGFWAGGDPLPAEVVERIRIAFGPNELLELLVA